MQLKLETNLPVIFLTLLVIAIVVLGYLELKKLTERIKVVEYLNTKNDKTDTKETPKHTNRISSQMPVPLQGTRVPAEAGHGVPSREDPPPLGAHEGGKNSRVEEWH
jgi:hypothetical protein